MRIGGMKKWVGSGMVPVPTAAASGAIPAAPAGVTALASPAPARLARWPTTRVAAVEALWGAGFMSPDGARETLRLATPLGLDKTLTLLLLGAGLGGPAAAIAAKFGGYVESFEAEPELAVIAEYRRRAAPGLRRVTVAGWQRDAPMFKPHSAHHALSLEAARGAPLLPILTSLAAALRPHGHIVLTELVCDGASPEDDREFAAWCRLENRQPALPRADTVGDALKSQGFDVRVVEDLSDKHVAATLSGWRAAVKSMADGPRPEPAAAGIFVTEAELWLLRVRLMRRFGFRLLRWHAIAAA
jgi:hypothetical protein